MNIDEPTANPIDKNMYIKAIYLSLKKPKSKVYLVSSKRYLLMYLYKSLILSRQNPIEIIPMIDVTSTRVI